MKNFMFVTSKGNRLSLLTLLVLMLVGTFATAQAPPEMFALVSFMKVEPQKQQAFEAFMSETMKPVHTLRREKGKIVLWILFKVHFTGANDEYNYASVSYYPAWENLEATFKFGDLVREVNPDANPPQIMERLMELGTFVRRNVLYQLDGVEPNPPVPSKYVRLDYMKVKDGKTAEYLRVERDDWKPFHQVLVKNGELSGWGLWQHVFPGGTSASFDYVTSSRYSTYKQVLAADYEKTFKVASPQKKTSDIFTRTTATRDLVKSELWEVVDMLN